MAKANSISEHEAGAIRRRNEQAILQAAEGVFSRHGYRGASLQEIARQAGLTKSNVLYYMGSKRKLYVRLLERMMARWNAILDSISPDDDPVEVISAFIRAKIRLYRSHPEGSRLFASEILGGAPFLQEYAGRTARLGGKPCGGVSPVGRTRADGSGGSGMADLSDLVVHPALRRF